MSTSMIEGYELSPGQAQSWASEALSPSTALRAVLALRLEGPLDQARLNTALGRLAQRHELLRTDFALLPGLTRPLQVLRPDVPHLRVAQTAPALANDLLAVWNIAASLPLEGAALQVLLVPHTDHHHTLLLALPALLADAATLALLAEELPQAYAADGALEDAELQFVDLAAWQHELLSDPDGAAGRAFWRAQPLAQLAQPLFPGMGVPGTDTPFAPAPLDWALPPATAHALAKQADPSLAVLAAWTALLARRSEQARQGVGLGWTTNGRSAPELAQALGPLSRTLPLLATVPLDVSFNEWLIRLGKHSATVDGWQEYFSTETLQEMGVVGYPLTFASVQLPEEQEAGQVRFSVAQVLVYPHRAALSLHLLHSGDTTRLTAHHDTAALPAASALALLDQFASLLGHALAQPDAPLASLPLLTSQQREWLLKDLNPVVASSSTTVPALLWPHVQATPNAPAITQGTLSLSYAQLWHQASSLALDLRATGVSAEAPVALWFERTPAAVVAMLGVMLAGAAFVPLDPALPPARVGELCQLVATKRLLAAPELATQLANTALTCPLQPFSLGDAELPAPLAAPTDFDPRQLAYLIFTSGSTGTPKPVAVEHQSLAAYLHSLTSHYHFRPGQRHGVISTLAADLGYTTLWGALASGGCVVLLDHASAQDPLVLAQALADAPLDTLKLVPSHLAALLSGTDGRLLPREQLFLGGSRLSWSLLATVNQLAPGCQVVNHYGPTETTIGVLTNPVASRPQADGDGPTLGLPLAHAQVHIVDEWGEVLPVGIEGEIVIGGTAVARGYLGQPAATAAAFIPDPFSSSAGARLYRTGDRGWRQADGTVVFVGRSDGQLKLRGYRIEPGEIAAVLQRHSAVQQALVLARAEPGQEPRLVAYFIPAGNRPPAIRELRQFLQERLPEYMVPSSFVLLQAFPLTPNGKIDTRALPAPNQSQRKASAPFVAPRNETEQALATLWSQVLNKEPIGIHDNFFELGGDSILSIQVVARAGQLNLQIKPKQLFDHPTIAQLAQIVETAVPAEVDQSASTGTVPLTPIQHWFFEQHLNQPHHYNQSVLLSVAQPFDLPRLEQALNIVVAHHDALRLRFSSHGNTWQQEYAANSQPIGIAHHDLSAIAAEQQPAAIEAASNTIQASLDLVQGPIIGAGFFELGGEQPGRLLLTIHHLAVDGISWSIILEDLLSAFLQLASDQTPQLAAKTTSFQYWANEQQRYAQSPALEQEAAYWLGMGVSELLPTDHPYQPAHNTYGAAKEFWSELEAEETEALQHAPATINAQAEELLLTALATAFNNVLGTSAIAISLEGHGRESIVPDVDLSRTVGWFTTRSPLALRFVPTASPRERLQAIKQQLRSMPNGGIGYGIVRYLAAETPIGQQFRALPEPQISFNYMGRLQQELDQDLAFGWANEPTGFTRSPENTRPFLLDINATLVANRLRITWTYSPAAYEETTIQRLADSLITSLRALAGQTSANESTYTPADFPQALLNQNELNLLLAAIDETDEEHDAQKS